MDNRFRSYFTAGVLAFLSSSCATVPRAPSPKTYTSDVCRRSFQQSRNASTDKQLDMITQLFSDHCFSEVISLGQYARSKDREKFFSATKEIAELFIPEGSLTDYSLESYERAYLSLLISLSFNNLGQTEAAMVELRRTSSEVRAQLYNYGEDPVLTLLQAAIWDSIDPSSARAFWRKLTEFDFLDGEIRKFANQRVEEIDRLPNQNLKWRIYGYGQLPKSIGTGRSNDSTK